MTCHIRDALASLGVGVLDHFVVGDGRCVSMAEREAAIQRRSSAWAVDREFENLGVSRSFGHRVISRSSESCRGSLSGEVSARSMAMAANATSADPVVRLDVFCVAEYVGDDRRRHKRWTKIGTAFPHRDGLGGMNVLLDALPPDKSLVILPRGDEKNEAGGQEERTTE